MKNLTELNKDFKKLANLRIAHPHILSRHVEEILKKYNIPYSRDFEMDGFLSNKMSEHSVMVTTFPEKLTDVVLVGKGVCYDSGGYNIKTRSMEQMYSDKTGAILALMVSIATGVPARVLFVNNLIRGNTEYLPGSILTSKKGVKVFIDNTDAEGRLVLADILESLPKSKDLKVISLATLTGAAVYFMGERRGALVHTLNNDVSKALIDTYSKDLLFPAPNHPAADKSILTKIKGADISNLSKSGEAGSQVGYSFLKHFYPAHLLTHVDIAAMDSDSDGNALGWGIKEISNLIKLVQKLS